MNQVQPIRILCVDHDPIVQEVRKVLLESHGYVVEVAGTTGEVCAKLKAQPFDLVIAEENLGSERGDDLALRVKRLRPHAGFILLTDAPTAAVAAAVDRVLIKSSDTEHFFAVVANTAEQYHALSRSLREHDHRRPRVRSPRRGGDSASRGEQSSE